MSKARIIGTIQESISEAKRSRRFVGKLMADLVHALTGQFELAQGELRINNRSPAEYDEPVDMLQRDADAFCAKLSFGFAVDLDRQQFVHIEINIRLIPTVDKVILDAYGDHNTAMWLSVPYNDHDIDKAMGELSKQLFGHVNEAAANAGFDYFNDPKANITLRVGRK